MKDLNEPILNKNLQVSKTVLKENLQTSKSTHIIGRKINNIVLSVKSTKNKKFSPNVVINQSKKRNESTKRVISKKSPGRSLSLNRILSEKDLKIEIPSYVSPPRVTKKAKQKPNKSSLVLEDLPKLDFCESACPSTPRVIRKNKIKTNKSSQILDDLSKLERPSPYNHSKLITKTLIKKKIEKIDKLEKNNSTLKEFDEKSKILPKTDKSKNASDKGKKKPRRILNCKTQNETKQGVEKGLRDTKNSDFDELKLKTDRDNRKLKKKKGIEVFSILKNRSKKLNKSAEALKHKKSPETSYGEILKRHQKSNKFQDFSRDESIKAKINTIRLEKTLTKKPKLKKKKKTKSMWVDEDKPTPVNRKKTRGQYSEDKREASVENKEILREKMQKLKQRVCQTKKTLLSKVQSPPDYLDHVLKIQRWFRKQIRPKLQGSLTSCDMSQRENWSSVFISPKFARSNSDLVQSFENKIFASVESEGKQLKTKTSVNSFHENSGSETMNKPDTSENQPKKVQKVPPLCLSSILQSKNISGEFNIESSDQVLNDSLSSEYLDSGSEESSIEQVKQISSLDIERQSDSSSSSVVSRESFENLSSDEYRNGLDRENWISRYVERIENEGIKKSSEKDESKEVFIREEKFEEEEEEKDDKSLIEVEESKEKDLKPVQEPAPVSTLQIKTHFEDTQEPAPLPQHEIFEKPVSKSTSYQSLFDKIQQLSGKTSKELLELYPIESPRLISDTSYPDLSYEDSCTSELSHLTDPELSLRRILQNNSTSANDLIERPENRMIRDSDSSEEENTPLVLHTDTNISEAQLLTFSSPTHALQEYDQDLQYLIESEVQDFAIKAKFKLGLKHIDTSLAFIEKYLKSLESRLLQNEDEILDLINTPAYQDPVSKLEYLQDASLGKLIKFPTLELILPQDLSSELKIEYDAIDVPSQQIYLQLIFDCVNEALNHIRPFAIDGLPDPWSPVSATLYGEGQIKAVVGKVLKLIRKWESVKCGMLVCRVQGGGEEKVGKVREERLNVLLAQNVRDSEGDWMDYEDEETQVKVEISRLAFEELIKETAKLL